MDLRLTTPHTLVVQVVPHLLACRASRLTTHLPFIKAPSAGQDEKKIWKDSYFFIAEEEEWKWGINWKHTPKTGVRDSDTSYSAAGFFHL